VEALTFLREDPQSERVGQGREVVGVVPHDSGAQASDLVTMVASLLIAESQYEAIEEQSFRPGMRTARQVPGPATPPERC
jgi:hypothetical protein